MKKTLRLILAAALGVPACLLLSCSGSGLGDNNDCDYIINAGLADGGTAQLSIDRQCLSFLSEDWDVEIFFAAPGVGADELPDPTARSNFEIAFYDVTYRNNLTGGTRPGIDVPQPIRVPVHSNVEVDSLVTLTGWPILEPGQQLQAPLNDAAFYPPGGVPFTAYITWWGWPVVDPEKACFQTITWEFTVFDSGTTAGCL